MKTLVLFLFLAGSAAALADENLLQNSDFSDGISHWEGDCHTASNSDDASFTTGVVIKLRNGDWTKISQDFDAKAGNYLLTITYTVSPGLSFSQRSDDYVNVPLKLELSALGPVNSTPNLWCMMVVDTGARKYNYWKITPKLEGSGLQTITASVQLSSGDSFKKGFFLGFPPGDGYINLQSISLVSTDAATTASP